MKKQVSMRVGARHIGQLGRELVTDYITALTELVKNSYDADAEVVEILFENIKSNDGRIVIFDTGSGISSYDIENKWAVIGTNSKVRETHSNKYKRRFAGKKGIGRFSVERLAEYCTIISFTETEKIRYDTNWNLYEGINIPEFIQRCEVLKCSNDISSAKYIKTVVEYLLLSEHIKEDDKKIIRDLIGAEELNYRLFMGAIFIAKVEETVLPILNKYKDAEQMINDVKNVILDQEDSIISHFEDELLEIYKLNNIEKDKTTGTILILDHLRDQWTQNDIEKIIKELLLLIAPTKKENNFKIIVKAEEYPNLERIELEHNVLQLAFAEVLSYFEKNDEDELVYVIEYKDKKGNNKTERIKVEEPFICGPFKLHLYYYIRDQKYLSAGTINQNTVRKILDAFCGVKVYRDGFRVRPYGDEGNDWLLLDSKKIRDTHGYLVGNNQLVGEVEVSQSENPLLVDATNREAIIENEAFTQVKQYVTLSIRCIQNIRYEDFKKEEAKRKEKQQEQEKEAKENREKATATLAEIVGQIGEIDTSDENAVSSISNEILKTVAEERNQSDNLLKNTKDYYDEQLASKERELDLYKNLASLGILAGAFGHETGDIFSRITNNIGYINDLCRLHQIYEEACFEELERDLGRVSSYSRLLLFFLKKDKRENKSSFNMGEVTRNLAVLYKKILTSFNINLDVTETNDVISPIKMYQIDFESIIINLVTNAFEAVKSKENRRIKISITETISDANIVVEDSGVGIPEDRHEWIFKPFNTTKKDDGVGLGLTILSDIVEKYKGILYFWPYQIQNFLSIV